MAEKYPFPVPESTLNYSNHRSVSLCDQYGWGWRPTDYLPLGLSCLENWGMKLGEQVKIFDEILDVLDSSLAYGLYHTLETLCADFDDLLQHARLSLPHDPVVKQLIKEARKAAMEEKKNSNRKSSRTAGPQLRALE